MQKFDNEIAKQHCKNDNIDFWNYAGVFVSSLLPNYIEHKRGLDTLQKLYNKNEYKYVYIKKEIAQNEYSFGKKVYTESAGDRFEKSQQKLFEWLDKTTTPYFYILNPVYFYDTYMSSGGYGLYKEFLTGINDHTLEVLKDYALYKLKY